MKGGSKIKNNLFCNETLKYCEIARLFKDILSEQNDEF